MKSLFWTSQPEFDSSVLIQALTWVQKKLTVRWKEPLLRQIQKKTTQKNPSLDVAKKYVETYSSCNAAAQYPEERVKLTYLHYFMNLQI